MRVPEHNPDLLGMPEPIHFEASGTCFPFSKAGLGAPILFVHGAWADLRIWCGLWERVVENYQFLAITQRHFGYGNWPNKKPFSRDIHTDDLRSLIKGIGKQVHLVGWSYAGGILLRVASELPELVRSLTIYEPSFESEAPPKEALLRQAREAFWEELEPAYSIAKAGDLDTAMRSGVEIVFGLGKGGFELLDPRYQRVFLDNAHTMIPELNAPYSKALKNSELKKVGCPTLIVLGERTHEQYRLMADATLHDLPNASTVTWEGVGHGGPVQVPDQFAKLILDFVQSNST